MLLLGVSMRFDTITITPSGKPAYVIHRVLFPWSSEIVWLKDEEDYSFSVIKRAYAFGLYSGTGGQCGMALS